MGRDAGETHRRTGYIHLPLQPGFPGMNTRFTGRWILDGGQWYIRLPL